MLRAWACCVVAPRPLQDEKCITVLDSQFIIVPSHNKHIVWPSSPCVVCCVSAWCVCIVHCAFFEGSDLLAMCFSWELWIVEYSLIHGLSVLVFFVNCAERFHIVVDIFGNKPLNIFVIVIYCETSTSSWLLWVTLPLELFYLFCWGFRLKL